MIYKLETYVPEDAAEAVKEAIFAAGAGRIGNYDRCCWSTAGYGEFRPLESGNPAIGKPGRVERVAEIKLELVVAPDALAPVLAALKRVHPYETPAFSYWPVNTEDTP